MHWKQLSSLSCCHQVTHQNIFLFFNLNLFSNQAIARTKMKCGPVNTVPPTPCPSQPCRNLYQWDPIACDCVCPLPPDQRCSRDWMSGWRISRFIYLWVRGWHWHDISTNWNRAHYSPIGEWILMQGEVCNIKVPLSNVFKFAVKYSSLHFISCCWSFCRFPVAPVIVRCRASEWNF